MQELNATPSWSDPMSLGIREACMRQVIESRGMARKTNRDSQQQAEAPASPNANRLQDAGHFFQQHLWRPSPNGKPAYRLRPRPGM